MTRRMTRPVLCIGAATLMACAHLTMRSAGLGAHLGAIAGMPIDRSSYAIAGLHVVVYLATINVAPVMALAGIFEIAVARRPR